MNFRREKRSFCDELESRITSDSGRIAQYFQKQAVKNLCGSPAKLPGEPEKGLFEVVVRLCRDFKILEVLLTVESDRASLDFALLKNMSTHPSAPGILLCETGKTALTFTSTLLPQSTIGMFSQTLSKSLCQLGTFL